MSTERAESASLVVFASGSGSNLRALGRAAREGRLPAKILALVTNVPGAGAVSIARELGVPEIFEIPSRGLSRAEHEKLVLEKLAGLGRIDWIVLAGYMRLFTPEFVRGFFDERRQTSRIVNIHPSLLPSFPGVDGYGQAVRHGVKVTGATVHLVTEGLDDGPIVAQAALDVHDDDSETTLATRGLELEHGLYPSALARLIGERWAIGYGEPASGPRGRPRVVFSEGAGG